MQVTTQTFTYGQIVAMTKYLKGTPEAPGLAHAKLPMPITVPLWDFLKRAPREMEGFDEGTRLAAQHYGEAETEEEKALVNQEYADLLNTEVSLKVYQIPLSALQAAEESERFTPLTVADLQTMDPFLFDDLDREHITLS